MSLLWTRPSSDFSHFIFSQIPCPFPSARLVPLGLSNLEKRWPWGKLTALPGPEEGSPSFCSLVSDDSTCKNSTKLHQGYFRPDTSCGKNPLIRGLSNATTGCSRDIRTMPSIMCCHFHFCTNEQDGLWAVSTDKLSTSSDTALEKLLQINWETEHTLV